MPWVLGEVVPVPRGEERCSRDNGSSEKNLGELLWRGVSPSRCLCCRGSCPYLDKEACAPPLLTVPCSSFGPWPVESGFIIAERWLSRDC